MNKSNKCSLEIQAQNKLKKTKNKDIDGRKKYNI